MNGFNSGLMGIPTGSASNVAGLMIHDASRRDSSDFISGQEASAADWCKSYYSLSPHVSDGTIVIGTIFLVILIIVIIGTWLEHRNQ